MLYISNDSIFIYKLEGWTYQCAEAYIYEDEEERKTTTKD
jgi:hypothetical protein